MPVYDPHAWLRSWADLKRQKYAERRHELVRIEDEADKEALRLMSVTVAPHTREFPDS